MSTIVFVHAHPDDEASSTSGSIARATALGHRVVIVYATDGSQGSLPEGTAGSLAELRRAEAEASAVITGAQRLVWLPYHDSGMRGWDANTAEGAFMQADVDAVARQIADVLDDEGAQRWWAMTGTGATDTPIMSRCTGSPVAQPSWRRITPVTSRSP